MNSNNGTNVALKRNAAKMYTKNGSYVWKKSQLFLHANESFNTCKIIFCVFLLERAAVHISLVVK